MLGSAMNMINVGYKLRIVGAAVTAAVVLTACGGGGGGAKAPSALDPANMVPASSVVYVSAAIRPQGAIKSNLTEAIDSVAGKGSAGRLYAKFEKSAGKQWTELKSWIGQRAGLALTGLPTSFGSAQIVERDLVVILPTNDPAGARKFLKQNVHQAFESWRVVGHYAILGGTDAVNQAAATTAKSSLAGQSAFKSAMTQLGSNELLSIYAPLHRLYQDVLPLLKSGPSYSISTLSSAAKQAPPGSSIGFGVAALHNQFRIDFVSHGMPTTSPPPTSVATDVGSLPGSAWLAMTLGGSLAKGGTVSQLTSSLSKDLGKIQAVTGKVGAHVPTGPLGFIEKDLLPALGPAEFAVSGTSETTLQAGLVMAPDNSSAGARLAKAVKKLVSGLPITSTSAAGRVAVTFGYSNLQQLLDPSSKLSGNPTFKHALAQLPAGAKADIYLNFAPITALASLDQSAATPAAMKVLHRLDYLIAGSTHSHFRLVLTTY
jgi:hypothetical protein